MRRALAADPENNSTEVPAPTGINCSVQCNALVTPKENWLGGFADPETGRPVHTLDSLKELLGAQFEFQRAFDMPFLIREHQRKYQYIISEATGWRKVE